MPETLPASAVVAHLTDELSDRLRDLWVLRDAMDAELSGQRHAAAVAQLSQIAAGLSEAEERLSVIAHLVGSHRGAAGSTGLA